MQNTRIALYASLVALAITFTGCRPKVTKAECDALVNKLVDLEVDEDPRAKEMTAEQRDATRATAKKAMASDPDVKKVEGDCEAEVSRAELACAMSAKSSAEWNACIE